MARVREAPPNSVQTRWSGRDIALVSVIILVLGCSWQIVLAEPAAGGQALRTNRLPVLAYAYLLLLFPVARSRDWRWLAAAMTATATVFVAMVADLTALRFFGSPFVELYPYLPVTARDASPGVVIATAASYVPWVIWLLSAGAIAVTVMAVHAIHDRGQMRVLVLALVPALLVSSAAAEQRAFSADPIAASLVRVSPIPKQALRYSPRNGQFALVGPALAQPETIVLVIMESAGAAVLSSDGTMSLGQRIVADSGARGWVQFGKAVTNSNATDISIPSLLTGSGGHESAAKLHTLPFLWHYAQARGYKAEFITSSTMAWAGFDRFLSAGNLDSLVTSADSRLPFINDLTVDDHFAYRTAADRIAASSGKLFVVLYVNALHTPFQTTSSYRIRPAIRARRARAAAIAESGFRDLFAALRGSERLDDALIIIAGDHGEFDNSSALLRPKGRIDTFEGGILSPIFQIKAPSSLPADRRSALRGNAGALVANMDIAPTIADMLGGRPLAGGSYEGYSLLRPIPRDRVAYAVATNEWRHWPRSAVAISQGNRRLTCDHAAGCRVASMDGPVVLSSRPAHPQDPLVTMALANPVVRRNLSQIYRVGE